MNIQVLGLMKSELESDVLGHTFNPSTAGAGCSHGLEAIFKKDRETSRLLVTNHIWRTSEEEEVAPTHRAFPQSEPAQDSLTRAPRQDVANDRCRLLGSIALGPC